MGRSSVSLPCTDTWRPAGVPPTAAVSRPRPVSPDLQAGGPLLESSATVSWLDTGVKGSITVKSDIYITMCLDGDLYHGQAKGRRILWRD